ncbi:chitin synthase [Plakobranchus ocellatus]|uniref:Chitin synthase n=1 Tax=Plakobranchus ocellatus TaxID=259542 RepID=A0AAV3ZN86_9GAST|nr:chitin synthase [Plakobranchus ocellatus]
MASSNSVTLDGYTVYTGANGSRGFFSSPSKSWSYKDTKQLSQNVESSDKNFKQYLSADSEESDYEETSTSVSRGGSPFAIGDFISSSLKHRESSSPTQFFTYPSSQERQAHDGSQEDLVKPELQRPPTRESGIKSEQKETRKGLSNNCTKFIDLGSLSDKDNKLTKREFRTRLSPDVQAYSDEDDPLRIIHRYHHQHDIPTKSDLGIGVRDSFDTYGKFDPTRNQAPFPPAAALHRQRFRSLPAIDVPSHLVDPPKPRRKLSVDYGTDKKTSSRRGSMPAACKHPSPKTSDHEEQKSKPPKGKKKYPKSDLDESGISSNSATASYTDSDSSNSEQKMKAKNTKDEKKDDKDLKFRSYDLFSTKTIEFDNEKVFHEILKVIRCSLYGFIILVLLVGTVANRISLSLMANNINRDKEICGESVVHLVLCLCAPLAFNWFNALMKILFGGKQWPSIKFFAANLIFELLTTFGWCLLVFRVLPSTDFFRGITVTLGIFQFPSVLKSLNLPSKCTLLAQVKAMCAFLAMIAQIGCPIYFLVVGFGTVPFAKE